MGVKNKPIKFHLKSSYVRKGIHSADGCYKQGKLNLIGGSLFRSQVLISPLAAMAFGAEKGNEELPSCLLLLPHPSGTAQGAFTLFTQARNWGMIRELNLGAEALHKSMARGGCLGSSGGRD